MSLPPERTQLSALTSTFLARFFENEATAGTTDMRQSFFWLIAALGAPGIVMPLFMYFRWSAVAEMRGLPAMHVTMLFDKSAYLALTFVGVSLLTALVWQALLVDRRDGLILGTLPVRARTITLAKLAAVAAYIGMVSAGMHTISTVIYGAAVASLERWELFPRVAAGQLVASTGANLFIFSVVVGLQSLMLAIAGPRRFARWSSALQIVVIAAATGLLLLMPMMVSGAADLARPSAGVDGLLGWLPPMWFVGLNERIAGTTFPAMNVLATRAVVALAAAVAVIAVCYPIAARRMMAGSVQGAMLARGLGARRLAAWFTRRLGLNQPERGTLQFMLAAFARTHQHRIVLSVTIGAALTLLTPIVLMYLDGSNLDPWHPRRGRYPVSLVAAPLLLNFVLAAGLRFAMAIPSELAASWIFASAPSPMFAGRDVARRFLIVVSVALPIVAISPIWIWHWGLVRTLPVIAACTLGMLTVVEAALWGFVGIPCAKLLATGRSGMTSQWPWLLAFLYFYADVFPSWQIAATIRPGAHVMLIPPILIWWLVRRGSQSAADANGLGGDPHGYLALDLSTISAISTKAAIRPPTKEPHA